MKRTIVKCAKLAPIPKTKQTSCPDCTGEGNIWGKPRHPRAAPNGLSVRMCTRCHGIGMIVVPK
jgi:hypothetical protein